MPYATCTLFCIRPGPSRRIAAGEMMGCDWERLDSNQRRLTPTGLQPVPFGHSGTLPCRGRRHSAGRSVSRDQGRFRGSQKRLRAFAALVVRARLRLPCIQVWDYKESSRAWPALQLLPRVRLVNRCRGAGAKHPAAPLPLAAATRVLGISTFVRAGLLWGPFVARLTTRLRGLLPYLDATKVRRRAARQTGPFVLMRRLRLLAGVRVRWGQARGAVIRPLSARGFGRRFAWADDPI